MLLRLLFWILLIVAAVWLWRRFTAEPPAASSNAKEETSKPMVRCAHCGVHLPKDSALEAGEQWYCSPEHQRLAKHD